MGFQLVKLLNEPINITFTGEITPMGEYNASVTYHIGESVSYGGSSYLARQDNIGHLPTETSFWQLLAEQGIQGPEGDGFPAGGTIGQVFTKASNADYDATWEDPTGGSGVNIDDLTEKTHISQDDKRVVYDAENGYAAKFERVYSSQQIFEAYSQAEEDQIYTDHPNFPVQVIRKDLDGFYKLTASVASFVITPQSTNLDLSSTYPFQFENTEFTMIGNESDLIASRRLVCAVAELNLGFQEAILSYAPVSSYNLTALVTEFTYTPVDMLTSKNYALTTTTTNFEIVTKDNNIWQNAFEFVGDIDSAPPAYFTAYQAGATGIASLDGSGSMRIKSATNDGAVMWRTNALTLAQTKTYKWKQTILYVSTTYEIDSEMGIMDATAKFAPNSDQSVYSLVRMSRFYFATVSSSYFKFQINYRTNAATTSYWNMSNAWTSTATYSGNFNYGTEYTYILSTTPTQFKWTVKSSDEATTLIDTAWVNWSDAYAPVNSAWLAIGDFRTNAYKDSILVNSFKEE